MNTRLHAQLKASPPRSFAPIRSVSSARKPVRGAANAGHDFGRVSVFRDGIYVDGPKDGTKTNPPKTQTPAPKTARCPTDIKVIHIEQIHDDRFGKNGMLTGIGAVAYMEVSDAGGNDWDGTLIKETVKQTKNTCGARARKVCSNESGENVDFKVGAATEIVGTKMTALKNTFYDLHMFALKDVSVLHESGKDTCEVQCSQTYQCGGKQFGPEFVITYSASRDTIAKTYDVTRIKVDVAPKAAKP